jgi:hypothetical protein
VDQRRRGDGEDDARVGEAVVGTGHARRLRKGGRAHLLAPTF